MLLFICSQLGNFSQERPFYAIPLLCPVRFIRLYQIFSGDILLIEEKGNWQTSRNSVTYHVCATNW